MESSGKKESSLPSQAELELKKEAKLKRKLLQHERIRVSFERLQLSWIRTSLTMLAIGVGAFHYFKERVELGKRVFLNSITGDQFGLLLIFLSFLFLLLATIQHIKSMATLKEEFPEMRYSVGKVLSYFIMIIVSLVLILSVLES
jgi:uncharacterized membrane protein YidH (DUF202 family)